jgi:hypothetical protein
MWYLRYMCLFESTGLQHILCCVFILLVIRLAYHMVSIPLDCPFLTVPSVTFVCTHHDKNSTVIITNWLKIIKYSFFK